MCVSYYVVVVVVVDLLNLLFKLIRIYTACIE